MSDLMLGRKLELLRMLGDWRDSAANRYWTRFNMFLLVTSLFGAALFLNEGGIFEILPIWIYGTKYPVGTLILSIAGVSFSLLWQQILRAAKNYEHRWYLDMEKLLSEEPSLGRYVHLYKLPGEKEDSEEDSVIKRTGLLSTQYAELVVRVFQILWAILAFVVCVEFVRRAFE